jgi:membrane dipeptidase
MFVIDGHEDIAVNALYAGRDVRFSVRETRARERAAAQTENEDPQKGPTGEAMIGLPELRRGGVGLVFATIFTFPREVEEMAQDGLAQLRYYDGLLRTTEGVHLITTKSELAALRSTWDAAAMPDDRPVGLVLLMEGADALRDPSELETWQRAGLRLLGPSWRATRYAGGTGEPGGLTDLGRELLRGMGRLGMVLDMSHIAEESFWQALDIFSGPVIASHSNCRVYVPTDRQLTDEMIRAIAARDGVIGTVLFNGFVVDGWQRGSDVPVTLEDVVRHIDHVCQLTGSARHSAIGSDFDGGFGVESTPVEFDSVADLEKLAGALERHGYSQDDVAGILGENWQRLLQRTLPE